MIGGASADSGQAVEYPRHVAIVMDGNGRWAVTRDLPRIAGHREGAIRVRAIVEECIRRHIPILTLFAFSTENWDRPLDEVDALMALIPERLEAERDTILKNRVRIEVLGEIDTLPLMDRVAVQKMVKQTADHDALTINIAFNYGGRAEILRAVRGLMRDGVDPADVTEEVFARYLYTGHGPDPDLVIRTAGEQRVSNFLIWQAAYAEYYFTPTLWPDFTEDEFRKALDAFGRRDRKFGRVPAAARRVGDVVLK